jgi:hypothetical protein
VERAAIVSQTNAVFRISLRCASGLSSISSRRMKTDIKHLQLKLPSTPLSFNIRTVAAPE